MLFTEMLLSENRTQHDSHLEMFYSKETAKENGQGCWFPGGEFTVGRQITFLFDLWCLQCR